MANTIDSIDDTTYGDDAKPAKPAKRKSVSLTAGDSRLTILALRKANDTGVTTVSTTDVKTKKTQRGMSAKYDSFAEACEAVKKLEHDAVQKGWKKSERAGGFRAKPDAFSSMPTAPKAKVSK